MRELKEVNYLFSELSDIRIFLTAGNHDFLKAGSAYEKFAWADNVTFFDSEEPEVVRVEEWNLTVYGHSYRSREITKPLYDDLEPEGNGGIHVLMAHGGDARHIPMNYRKIAGHGFAYVAMGHIHRPRLYPFRDRGFGDSARVSAVGTSGSAQISGGMLPGRPASGSMAYAGALEPLDVNDIGPHGYIEGDISWDEAQGGYRTTLTFLPAAKRSYIHLELELREEMTAFEAEQRIRECMEELGDENLFKIILGGCQSPGVELRRERLLELGNVAEVENHARTAYDFEALKQHYQGQLIGRYLESYGEGELSELELRSRICGLTALLETQ